MGESLKLRIISTIWIAFAVVMLALLATNIVASATPGIVEIIIASVVSGVSMISTIVVWTEGEDRDLSESTQKAKRRSLDDVLDTLTDDQLDELRYRLSRTTMDDLLAGDDGELYRQNSR